MERRVLLAIFLSFIVIYVWQAIVFQPAPGDVGAPTTATSAVPSAPGAAPPAAPDAAAPSPPLGGALVSSPEQQAAPVAVVLGDSSERDIRVETQDVIAVFTNRGAVLKSWRLKHYRNAGGEPLELLLLDLPAGQPRPFSLKVADSAVSGTLNESLYAVRGAPSPTAGPQTRPVELRFEYQDASGVRARKEFRLDQTSFGITFKATVDVNGRSLAPTIQWGPAVGDVESASRSAVPPGGLLASPDDEERLTAAAITTQPVYEGTYDFAGVEDHYFLTIALAPGPAKVTFSPLTIPAPAGSEATPRTLVTYSLEPAPGDQPLRFYVGPKDFDELAKVDRGLVRAIDFGVFTVIVVPLLRSLKWINGYVGNYGWSILVLTAIINLIILPLRHKSVVSMRKMQEIQPEAKAIQDRYAKLKATDPAKQKMNQELMALYRERGVNPAGGCVPMLLPFPILLAFYSLLSTAIELRGAPFILWIQDLSQPDPYYVVPILMGLSQLWQQWIQPATGVDPIQRRMMMAMPVVFMFLFINSASGLALYWFASNVWAIGQQYATNYIIGPPNIRSVKQPGGRSAKRVGTGKTDAAARES